jgi:hypothetical protein
MALACQGKNTPYRSESIFFNILSSKQISWQATRGFRLSFSSASISPHREPSKNPDMLYAKHL